MAGAFDLPLLRSSLPAVDIDGFFRAVGEAFTTELNLANVAEANRPLFLEEWPKERLAKPGIPFDFFGYHVVLSRRASTSNQGYRAAKGLTLIEQKPSRTNAGYTSFTFGWLEEAVVQFTVFAQSNRRATDLMKWFQALVTKYHTIYDYFKARGVNYFVFHQRLEDGIEKAENQDLYTRRLQYVVRVQNLLTLEAKSLESLQLNVGLRKDGEIDTITLPVAE
jgi:hypothetical protein